MLPTVPKAKTLSMLVYIMSLAVAFRNVLLTPDMLLASDAFPDATNTDLVFILLKPSHPMWCLWIGKFLWLYVYKAVLGEGHIQTPSFACSIARITNKESSSAH